MQAAAPPLARPLQVSCFDQTGCRNVARTPVFLDGTELNSKTFSTLHRSPLPMQGFVSVRHFCSA